MPTVLIDKDHEGSDTLANGTIGISPETVEAPARKFRPAAIDARGNQSPVPSWQKANGIELEVWTVGPE